VKKYQDKVYTGERTRTQEGVCFIMQVKEVTFGGPAQPGERGLRSPSSTPPIIPVVTGISSSISSSPGETPGGSVVSCSVEGGGGIVLELFAGELGEDEELLLCKATPGFKGFFLALMRIFPWRDSGEGRNCIESSGSVRYNMSPRIVLRWWAIFCWKGSEQ